MGAQELGPFPGQNWHHLLAARPQRWVAWRGEGRQKGDPSLPTGRTWAETEQQGKWGRPASEHSGGQHSAWPGLPSLSAPGSLEGLPLLPELLY